jgi:hypothetical protein
MPLFLIERRFAEELDVAPDVAQAVNEINADEGVRWLYSFLSADRRKTYCIYEAADPEALLAAARRAGLPADVIVEVSSRIDPTGKLVPI